MIGMASKVFQLLGEIVIDYNSGNIDKAKKDAEELKKSLAGVETEAKDAGGAMEEAGETGAKALDKNSKIGVATVWLGNALWNIALKAANIGKQLISSGMEYNAAIEGYEANFVTLLEGDAQRAKQLMKDLETLAMESPFDLGDTAKAAQDLLIYGTAADDIIPTIKMMGDITLGSTERMSRLALAYNQMLGKGRLMAQEQNQMTEAGVPIVDIVIDYYRKTNWVFKEAGEEAARALYDGWREEGLISAKDVQAALFEASQEGGRFYGGMARAMETYEGKTQMAAEAGNKAAGKLFEPFFEVYKADVLPNLTEALQKVGEWATENEDTLKSIAESLASIANVAFEPSFENFQTMAVTTWEKTVKPALEKAISWTIEADFVFPTAGSVFDELFENMSGVLELLPEELTGNIKMGDKSLAELYEEYKKGEAYRKKQEELGIGKGNSEGLTFNDIISGNVYTGTTKGNGLTEYQFKQSNNVNGWGMQNGMYGAYGFYGDYGLGEALNQFDAGTSGKLSQIIGLLSAILGAVSRPMSIDIRTLSSHINTQLGRTLQRTVL